MGILGSGWHIRLVLGVVDGRVRNVGISVDWRALRGSIRSN